MASDQADRIIAGSTFRKTIETILKVLQEAKLIKGFDGENSEPINSPHFGYPGKYQKQFRCDYIVTLNDETKLMIHSEKSYDDGRFKSKEWDTLNIKKIDKKIDSAYLIYPDELMDGDAHNFAKINEKIANKEVVTNIDGVINQTEFLTLIEDKVLGNDLNGSKAAKKGLIFEYMFASVMSLPQNFELWKNPNSSVVGWKYDLFRSVMDYLKMNPKEVDKISATCRIDDLPNYVYSDGTVKSGGKAKTDVILYVTYVNGSKDKFRFSCKNSSQDWIHVNQFSAKYVVDLLELSPDREFEHLFEQYRIDGGPRNFQKKHPKEFERLDKLLYQYRDSFERWCLSGYTSNAKDGASADQVAEYIVACKIDRQKNVKYSIEDIETYIKRMRIERTKKTFGTIFSWTVTKKDENGKYDIRVKTKL